MATDTDHSPARTSTVFAVRVALGLSQGFWLYVLYRAADGHFWPATEPASFAPQLLIALYMPLLVSQAIGAMRLRTLLPWAVGATVLLCGLATYDRLRAPITVITSPGDLLPTFALFFFGFAGLFIAQSLIAGGDVQRKYIAGYGAYFDTAWKMGVQFALAAVFVGVFWGVLWLGAGLFNLIKLDFLENLIEHDWFAIPVTALATAAAIHLTDVRARLVAGIRGVVLTLLGWLLPLMALIAVGFLVGIVFTGFAPLWQTRAATAGLLGAAAMLVVLINAAYQNGENESARPALLRHSEAIASFALVPLVLISAYALTLRVAQYGWTVERIVSLACIVAALCYALGYAAAAVQSLMVRRGMALLEPVNIGTAFVVLVLLLALFTPLADPEKLSVDDQIARLRSGQVSAANFDYDYLKQETGRFGTRALQKLATSKTAEIARRARYALTTGGALPAPPPPPLQIAKNVTVYPKGKSLPAGILKQDWSTVSTDAGVPSCLTQAGSTCDAIVTDLNGDGVDEVIVVTGSGDDMNWYGSVLAQQPDGRWTVIGTLPNPHCKGDFQALRNGNFKLAPPITPALGRIQIGGRDVMFTATNRYQPPTCPK